MVPVLLLVAARLTTCATGNVLSFHVFGTVIVVLNTAEATKDLLEKRGDICSDRPVVPIFEMYARLIKRPCLLNDMAQGRMAVGCEQR